MHSVPGVFAKNHFGTHPALVTKPYPWKKRRKKVPRNKIGTKKNHMEQK